MHEHLRTRSSHRIQVSRKLCNPVPHVWMLIIYVVYRRVSTIKVSFIRIEREKESTTVSMTCFLGFMEYGMQSFHNLAVPMRLAGVLRECHKMNGWPRRKMLPLFFDKADILKNICEVNICMYLKIMCSLFWCIVGTT